ncbi:LysE/ArgO family amino acid transporter [Zavarzinia sp. CC-PAN008]|uniref:LysE/ArgO family amino acid transporter n=1 Tax=Zavarzinia sp. CC-PAN008 TaxID=3243332 RepID=UPI003F7457A5
MAVTAAGEGFALGLGLIVAIGAQNAFILRQGLMRRHVGPLVAFCATSDALLILAGVLGLGTLVQAAPGLMGAISAGGAAFLLAYGALALKRAARPQALLPTDAPPQPLARDLAVVAGVTLLNPHVYLDTVVLLGSISARHPWPERAWFAGGAMTASVLWFTGLGYGARVLAPVFRRPAAWRVLDLVIAAVMTTLGLTLAWEALAQFGLA